MYVSPKKEYMAACSMQLEKRTWMSGEPLINFKIKYHLFPKKNPIADEDLTGVMSMWTFMHHSLSVLVELLYWSAVDHLSRPVTWYSTTWRAAHGRTQQLATTRYLHPSSYFKAELKRGRFKTNEEEKLKRSECLAEVGSLSLDVKWLKKKTTYFRHTD